MSVLEDAFYGAGWDESQHPRNPSGTPVGGQFSSKTTVVVGPVEVRGEGPAGKVYHADEQASTLPAEITAWKEEEPRTYAQKAYFAAKDPGNHLIVVRRDGELIGVGQFTDTGGLELHGGYFGAVKGGGLPLFNAFLEEAEKRGVGAVWEAGNERAAQLYNRLGIPYQYGPPSMEEFEEFGQDFGSYEDYVDVWREEFGNTYALTADQVRLLSADMFALAREPGRAQAERSEQEREERRGMGPPLFSSADWPALFASGWVEEDHPRDPGGEHGGEFIAKGTTAEAERPVMGLGTPEQEANLRSKNAVPPLVEEQMEADLKAFLDESDLQMRMPESALLEVLSDGEFYNQHQAQAARGMGRSPMSEALMFGLDEATDPSQLPKYGYLGPDTEGVIGYGGVKVFFKDEVKDRSTFVVGDSLMHGPAVVMPSPVRDPSYLSAGVFQIDEAMTAWADSMGMIGEYDPENPESGMNLRYGSETDFIPSGEGWHYSLAEGNTSVPYFEAQIYGKLTPDDIERVEILPEEDWDLEDPLTGLPQVEDHAKLRELITQLEKRKIPIGTYDAPGDYSGEWA